LPGGIRPRVLIPAGLLAGKVMPDIPGKSAPARFFPEARGWVALRLVPYVPAEIRSQIEQLAGLRPGVARPGRGVAGSTLAMRAGASAGASPTARGASGASSFTSAALALVSHPAAVAWSREIAERVPALGVGAGPACIARLWAARLLSPRGGLDPYWPSVVACVWAVVRPVLEKLGVTVDGWHGAELRHEVAAPLALVFLKSLAAGRKDLRLLGMGDADRPDGLPFGWAPGMDAPSAVIRYLVVGQVPGPFRSHALMSSPLARLVRAAGIALPVTVARWRCTTCRAWTDAGGGRCPQCGDPLAVSRVRRLVASRSLCSGSLEPRRTIGPDSGPGLVAARLDALAVHERVEAAMVRRGCVERARRLWWEVIQNRRTNVSAMLVLGALAGLRPLAAVAEQPPPEVQWLAWLVETLADGRLDRQAIAGAANEALETVASRLGRPRPARILSAYVGVLATRFRHRVLRPPEPANLMD